jgi:hypothetical protein
MPFNVSPFGFGGVPQPTQPLGQRSIVKSTQRPSEYVLDDGTKLIIKPTLIDVKRVEGQWGIDGKPTYIMTLTNVTETESPAKIMRPVPKQPSTRLTKAAKTRKVVRKKQK